MLTYSELLENALNGVQLDTEVEQGLAKLDDGVREVATEALAYREALKSLANTHAGIGYALLAGLWHIHKNGLLSYMGESGQEWNPEDLSEWARETFEGLIGDNYIYQLCYAVQNVLTRVHAAEMSGSPFVTESGEIIDVNFLLRQRGALARMLTLAATFTTAAQTNNREAQDEIVQTIASKTTAEAEEVRDRIGNRIKIVLPFKVLDKPNDLFDVVLSGISYEQVGLFRKLMGKAGDELLA